MVPVEFKPATFRYPDGRPSNKNFTWSIPEDETANPDLTCIQTTVSRLLYFGHVLRMDNSKLPKITLHGEINKGFRPTGRPKEIIGHASSKTSNSLTFGSLAINPLPTT